MKLAQYLHLRWNKLAFKKFLQPISSFSEVLPYEDLIEQNETAFLLLKSGRIGAGLKIQWPHHLTTDDKALEDLEATVARLIQSFDSSYRLQFQLEKWDGVFTGFVFFLSPKVAMPLPFVPKRAASIGIGDFDKKMQKLSTFMESFASATRSEGAKVWKINGGEFINLLAKRFDSNGSKDLHGISVCDGKVGGGTLELGDKHYQALVPTSLPAKFASQVLRPLLFEKENFIVSAGLRVLSKGETEARINQRKFWLQNALGAGAARQREEVETFEKDFTTGDCLVGVTLVVITDGPDSSPRLCNLLSQATQTAWAVELAGASKVIIDSLPFNHDSDFMERIGRSLYLPSFTCCKVLPLTSGSIAKEPGKPLQYPSVEGEATGFDLRDTPGCHAAVIAGTRSGKSFLISNILHKYRSSINPPVISIIDKRASYETLTLYHGGAVVSFSPERLKSPDFPFHPLAGPLDDAHIEFLSSYVGLLAELAKPDEPIYAVDKVIITEAIRTAVESAQICAQLTSSNEGPSTLIMSDIASALGRSNSPVAKGLAFRLRPYYGNGTYAGYFDREHKTALKDSDIVSFDLDGLESDALLQSAMSQAILGQIMARMRKASKEGRWGILLVEEIGVLGDSIGGLAQFVADAWKTMAKMGVVCIGVTNDVEDYLHKPAAKAIWNNSPNKIFLRMTNDQIRNLVTASDNGPAVVGGQLAELLPCLKTIPGEKADFILTAEDRIYPLCFHPDPKSYWLGTSRHEDILKIKNLTQSMTIKEAITQLSEG